MTEDITARIKALKSGPKDYAFEIFRDEPKGVWLGRLQISMWMLEIPEEERGPLLSVAAEGATVADVLRKLAEMLE